MTRTSSRDDRGESLLEVMMAVGILGIAIVAILGSLGTLIVGTDAHRQQSQATAILLSASETLKGPGTTYVACATTTEASYAAALADTTKVSRPAGWAAPGITEVRYWNGTSFAAPGSDLDPATAGVQPCLDTAAYGNLLRLQQLTLAVSDPKSRTTETLSVVKRSQP